MTVVRQQVTAEELLYMPDDGFRYELVRGELRKMTPAGNVHGRIAMRVAWPLARYVEEKQLGAVYAAETGFRLADDPDTVRAPDVAFVGRKRLEAVGEVEGFWPGAPDLVVEVISPATATSKSRRRSSTGWKPVRRWSSPSTPANARQPCTGR